MVHFIDELRMIFGAKSTMPSVVLAQKSPLTVVSSHEIDRSYPDFVDARRY